MRRYAISVLYEIQKLQEHKKTYFGFFFLIYRYQEAGEFKEKVVKHVPKS